jgi:cytochrome P450
MTRKVLKPFTFSDGTTLPVGSTVAVPLSALQNDAELYNDPYAFDALRFCREENEESKKGNNQGQMVTTGLTYVSFGHGQHSW